MTRQSVLFVGSPRPQDWREATPAALRAVGAIRRAAAAPTISAATPQLEHYPTTLWRHLVTLPQASGHRRTWWPVSLLPGDYTSHSVPQRWWLPSLRHLAAAGSLPPPLPARQVPPVAAHSASVGAATSSPHFPPPPLTPNRGQFGSPTGTLPGLGWARRQAVPSEEVPARPLLASPLQCLQHCSYEAGPST